MRTCNVEGCTAKHDAKGMCKKHYSRWKRHGDPKTVLPPSLAGARVHGMSHSRVYKAWVNMHRRCKSKHPAFWKYYGKRGITVCARWGKFETFFADMGEPGEGMSIDRINNDQGYSPDNCRWATASEQARNTRQVVLAKPDRIRMRTEWLESIGKQSQASLACLADRYGVSRQTARNICVNNSTF